MIKIGLILVFLFFASNMGIICFAQTSAAPLGQVERSEELLNKDEALRKKIEEPEKVFIEEIILTGFTLSDDQIKEMISPYQKRWLTKNNIQDIIDLLREACQQKSGQAPEISFEVKGRQLIISAEVQ
ncbi:MAG: hypothetical protein M0R66_05905 [Candidatus Omnitrophica bacterium]|nr:hypothetical protein [Candidatus Omnitrophota bacterium]